MLRSIAIIGANGRMGSMIHTALMRNGDSQCKVWAVINRNRDRVEPLIGDCSYVTNNTKEAISSSDAVIQCIRPTDFNAWAEKYSTLLVDKYVLSCMAGWSADRINEITGCRNVVHFMPSVTMVGKNGIFPASFCSKANSKAKKEITEILKQFGQMIETTEKDIMEYAHLTSCMPAIFCKLLEIIADQSRIGKEEAMLVLVKTITATTKLLQSHSTEEIIDLVCTPQGITESAIDSLKGDGTIAIQTVFWALHKKYENLEKMLRD